MLARSIGALMLVAILSATAWADDRPIDRGEIDRRIVTSVYQTALLGTDIFNKGKHEECFRLYQGALTSLQSLLDHRPMLMGSVKDKLDRARNMKASEAAFLLREALDEIQNEIAPHSGSDAAVARKPVPKKTNLWERLGGEKTVRAIVKDFTAAAAEDKKINFFRDGKIMLDEKGHARMDQLFVELISIMAGGPLEYSQKRNLKEAHAGMKISNAEFDALLAVFQKTLDKHKIGKSESDELLAHLARTRPVIVEVKEK